MLRNGPTDRGLVLAKASAAGLERKMRQMLRSPLAAAFDLLLDRSSGTMSIGKALDRLEDSQCNYFLAV